MQPRARPSSLPRVNHARLNAQQIKEQEAINRERKRQDDFEQDRQRQLIERQKAQYSHVSSAYAPGALSGAPVAAAASGAGARPNVPSGGGPVDDVEITVFVRECDRDAHSFVVRESSLQTAQRGGPMGRPAAEQQYQQPSPTRYGVQQQQQPQAVLAPRVANTPSQQRPAAPHSAPADTSAASRPKMGEVPLYLRQRKAELDAEKLEALRLAEVQREQAKYPPGHRPVSDEERVAILQRLAERKKGLEADLGRLPMRFDTQAVRNRQRQLESELAEVEEAERKFSVKKQLYVPI
jgi:hypothetical protein